MVKDKYINNINKRIGRTIRKQELIQADDVILVALSGGKDSMVLLEALAEVKKVVPFGFTLYATHIFINNIGYKTDIDYLEQFCKKLGIGFILKDFAIDFPEERKKSECFLCSWNRRKAIFELTKEYNCNKLAFGHHMDDAIETLLMNMVYHGSISAMPFKFSMFEGKLDVIRPLLEMKDAEMREYADRKAYRREVKSCLFEDSKRKYMKEVINNLNKNYKVAAKNIFRSMDNIYHEYLPHWNKVL